MLRCFLGGRNGATWWGVEQSLLGTVGTLGWVLNVFPDELSVEFELDFDALCNDMRALSLSTSPHISPLKLH